MPASDLYHDAVVKALTDDGWTITDDPLRIGYGGQTYWVDLGATRETLAAEKDGEKIAVEIKSFLGKSLAHDLHDAVGQYNNYRDVLSENDPERILFLAVTTKVYDRLFAEKYGQFVINRQKLNLIVFDPTRKRIIQWIPQPKTN
ncbi:MAG: element excision factor XisH family protein [Blastocatellia bacterium]